MRYTALEKLFILLFSLTIIACFVIFTILRLKKINLQSTQISFNYNPFEVLVWLCLISFSVLLYFSIRGIYKGRKRKLKNKFQWYSIIINIIFIGLFNPITFYLIDIKPTLNPLPFWITMHIIGIIYVFIFMLKMLSETTPESDSNNII